MLSTREVLMQQRQRCLDALRAIGPKASRLVTEMESLDMALFNIMSGMHVSQYGGFRKAIDAIVHCLRENARVMTEENLAQEISLGGWLNESTRAFKNVKDSLHYHTRRQGVKKRVIREMNGYVGLFDWPDEKFEVVRDRAKSDANTRPLTGSQQRFLNTIRELAKSKGAPASLEEIAEALGVTKGTVSQLVHRLRIRGLILSSTGKHRDIRVVECAPRRF